MAIWHGTCIVVNAAPFRRRPSSELNHGVNDMPFYVRLAEDEKPPVAKRATANAAPAPDSLRDVAHGIKIGLGLLVVAGCTYWAISAHIASFPDTQSLLNYWLASR